MHTKDGKSGSESDQMLQSILRKFHRQPKERGVQESQDAKTDLAIREIRHTSSSRPVMLIWDGFQQRRAAEREVGDTTGRDGLELLSLRQQGARLPK